MIIKRLVNYLYTPFYTFHFVSQSAFTLIELIVVIAVVGVLAASLLIVIDPADKINSANDAGVMNNIKQIGLAEDSHAINYSTRYTGANNNLATAITDLYSKGQVKFATLTPPTGYTWYYFTNPTNCTTTGNDCLDYFVATTLKSKRFNPGGVQGYFYVKNGKACRVSTATAPTTYTSFDALTCL